MHASKNFTPFYYFFYPANRKRKTEIKKNEKMNEKRPSVGYYPASENQFESSRKKIRMKNNSFIPKKNYFFLYGPNRFIYKFFYAYIFVIVVEPLCKNEINGVILTIKRLEKMNKATRM